MSKALKSNRHKYSCRRLFVLFVSTMLALTGVNILSFQNFHAEPAQAVSDKDSFPDSYQAILAGYSFDAAPIGDEVQLTSDMFNLSNNESADGVHEGQSFCPWLNEEKSLMVSFSSKTGYYFIEIDYLCEISTASDIVRSLMIDGKEPFAEARSIKFPRVWESGGPAYIDAGGNERSVPMKQKERIQSLTLTDLNRLYSEPLIFSLDEGEHTLTLGYISGALSIAEIRLVPYQPVQTYEQYREKYSSENYSGSALTFEAENLFEASERIFVGRNIKDTTMSPFDVKKSLVNAVGGWVWRNGNEWVSWELNAPVTGWYTLALRVEQDYAGSVSFRQIAIDGEVPFREMLAYPFASQDGLRTELLGGDKPFLFYLEEGKHIMSMQAVVGDTAPIIMSLQALSQEMSTTIRDVQTVTGLDPDPYFDYELDKKLPWLLDTLTGYIDRIENLAGELEAVSSTRSQFTSGMRSEADKLRNLVNKPHNIPKSLTDLSQIPSTLADFSSNIQYVPLLMDFIQLMPPGEAVVQREATFLQKLQLLFWDFIQSFTADYEQSSESTEPGQVLDVWVSRGRDWGETIQQMTVADFTPRTGVSVRFNIISAGNAGVVGGTSALLLSLISGREPDIALGSDMDTPVELAIRKSAQDLSGFSGFEEVVKRFHPEAVTPFGYNGGVYALPETMNIPLLIYRSDIIEEMGISIPETWEELWQFTIPKLSRNNALFHINPDISSSGASAKIAVFSSMLFQNGGKFYNENGSSALDSEAAFTAFDNWVRAFTQYRAPRWANLYNEMRIGSIPMAIGYLDDYLMLDIAAPELYGRLEIAPIPGTRNEEGDIVRYGAGTVTSAIMFEKAGDRKDAAWQFMDWWTSGDVQEQFSSEIVAKLGSSGRWYSANLSAFYAQPWGGERLKVIQEWMPWYRNLTNTLGGYMTPRAIGNAWTRSVTSGQKTRDSLEEAYQEIEIEIARKRKQYDLPAQP